MRSIVKCILAFFCFLFILIGLSDSKSIIKENILFHDYVEIYSSSHSHFYKNLNDNENTLLKDVNIDETISSICKNNLGFTIFKNAKINNFFVIGDLYKTWFAIIPNNNNYKFAYIRYEVFTRAP